MIQKTNLLKISRKDGLSLYSQSVQFTTIGTIHPSFIEDNTAQSKITLSQLTCIPKKLQLDQSINLNCQEDKKTSASCSYNNALISTYGEHELYSSNISLGVVSIYPSLSKSIISTVIPSYLSEENNLLIFSTNKYNLTLVTVILNNNQLNGKEVTKITNEIRFTCFLNKGETNNITLSAEENSVIKAITYLLTVEEMSFSVQPDVFFVDKSNLVSEITFEVVFTKNKDLVEFKD